MEKPLSLKELACKTVSSVFFNLNSEFAVAATGNIREYFETNLPETVLQSFR